MTAPIHLRELPRPGETIKARATGTFTLHGVTRIGRIDGNLLDLSSLIRAMRDVKPDEVYNLGAQSFVRSSWNQPLLTGQVLVIPRKGDEIDSILRHNAGAPYTLVKLTPSHLRLLNQRIVSTNTTEAPMRTLMVGGEALVKHASAANL